MKTNLLKTLAVAAVGACFAATTASAIPINGEIDFAGSVTLDAPLASANAVTTFNSMFVFNTTGDFTGVATFTPAAFTDGWTFDPSSSMTPLWSVGGFSFNLLSSTIVSQTASFLNIAGLGYVSAAGKDDTLMTWTFTISHTGSSTTTNFTAAASNSSNVPDGGTTAALLGAAMIGLFFVSRRLAISRA